LLNLLVGKMMYWKYINNIMQMSKFSFRLIRHGYITQLIAKILSLDE
jgi:hypothetical protein